MNYRDCEVEMFPVIVLTDDGVELPSSGNYYIITADGVFLHKETRLITATVKVEGVPFLQGLRPTADLHLPKLPAENLARILRFFRRVHRQLNSEAVVLINYCPDKGEYRLSCPEQKVSSASLDYDRSERFDGYLVVGSIHSHNRMDAFHSGTDLHDEKDFDGLHITLGRMDYPYFNITCSVAVNNNRFLVAPEDFILGIQPVEWKPKPTVVRRRKKGKQPKKVSVVASYLSAGLGLGSLNPNTWETKVVKDRNQYYDIVLPEGRTVSQIGYPRSWIKRVTPQVPTVSAVPSADGHLAYQYMVEGEGGGLEEIPIELLLGGWCQ